MTLRHRLLLVYLIVVLLSVATVGVAIYELNRTQSIYGPLSLLHDVLRDADRLKSAFRSTNQEARPEEFNAFLSRQRRRLSEAGEYLDVDYLGDHLTHLQSVYQAWQIAPSESKAESAEMVNRCLDIFTDAVGGQLERLKEDREEQRTRKWGLLGTALGFGILNVLVVGLLLRRWLLWPMERLNRQVEALGKDQPAPEPLLASPLEMAKLASALDRARQSLQAYRRQLIENERLTTIGQFAAQLAHNLRNPLASIRAAAQVTARHERGSEYVHGRMDEVMACVDRLNHWIAGLMEVARRDPTPTRNADVVPLLHRVREALTTDLAVKEIALTVEAPAHGLMCSHDPATLEQALIAMMVNAIEASPLGGRIVLKAERVQDQSPERQRRVQDQSPERQRRVQDQSPERQRRVQDQSPERQRRVGFANPRGVQGQGDQETRGQEEGATTAPSQIRNPESEIATICRISVNDEGPGLPTDDPERIFEFSYSTKQKGMGLGLALARLTRERQGGVAHACNRPEGGAMVYVDLPIAEGDERPTGSEDT